MVKCLEAYIALVGNAANAAKVFGIDSSLLSRYRSGKRVATVHFIMRMHERSGIPIEDLVRDFAAGATEPEPEMSTADS
jgi:transcriptional regulator with XRE-family HTH domain